MGAGFAAYVGPGDVPACLAAAQAVGITALLAGRVVKEGRRKAVEIEPLDIVFDSDILKVKIVDSFSTPE